MNKIHTAESDSKEIPEGQMVRTNCGKKLVFRSHGGKPPGGVICLLCNGYRPKSKVGTPPFFFAIIEEEKPLIQIASA